MPSKVERHAMKVAVQLTGQWLIHHAVESGGVGHDKEWPFTAEVVHGNLHPLT